MSGTATTDRGRNRPSSITRNERGEDVFARAQRHSRFVRILKFVLPVSAVLMAGAFIGYSLLASSVNYSLDIGTPTVEDGELVMANPQLGGFTKDNRPYKMTAARAKQAIGGGSSIELEEITATVPIDNENFATVVAPNGTFNRESNRLDIDNSLLVKTTSGLEARLRSAQVDIDASTLRTEEPVEIKLNGTRISADSLEATDGGKVLVFENRVKVNIDPSRLNRSESSREISASD